MKLSADKVCAYKFGKYSVCIHGENRLLRLLPHSWERFSFPRIEMPDVVIRLQDCEMPRLSDKPDGWSKAEIGNKHVVVYSRRGKVIFAIEHNVFCKDACVCVSKPLDSYVRIGVHYALLTMLHSCCVGLHGVTIRCDNQVIILSAPSGTGKTTLAELLQKYKNAEVVNGDFALLSYCENGVYFEPTPFCGTSRQAGNNRVKVDRIIFLEQAAENHMRRLHVQQALKRMMSNVFVPEWDARMVESVLNNVMNIVSILPISVLAFAPVKEATDVFQYGIRCGN